MTSRADAIQKIQQRNDIVFSDISNNLAIHPVNQTLVKVTNVNSIVRAFRNLVNTNLGERPYRPDIGTDINKQLFNPSDAVAAKNIEFYVQNLADKYEPRIKILQVNALPAEDNNAFSIDIVFTVINTSEPPRVITVILRRVR
jgi:phage baseplate assembly protein W